MATPGGRSSSGGFVSTGGRPVGAAPSEEDGGLTYQRVAILGAHLFLSLAHVFAVHQSAAQNGIVERDVDNNDENDDVRTYKYSPAMVVFLAELLKLLFSVGAYVYTHIRDGASDWHHQMKRELHEAMSERRYLRFSIPAFIYLIENHLRFIVLSKLDSPITWVVFSHIEIPIVAVLSWLVLKRGLRKHQWVAVVLLLDGVMAAEISLCHARGDDDPTHPSCDSFSAYPIAAMSLVLFGALLAALAGIAVEFVYKEHFHTSIHLQNGQLYLFGVVANGLVVMFSGGGGSSKDSIGTDTGIQSGLEGFTASTWWVTITLAAFGIVSSLIMKHLSNIAKVFNSAAGMVVVTVLSVVFLGTQVTLPFFLAAGVILASLFSFYSSAEDDKSRDGGKVLGPGVDGRSRTGGSANNVRELLSSRGSFAFDVSDTETKQLL